MRNSDLHELPPSVRHRYLNTPDDFFDKHPEVIELRSALVEAEERAQAPAHRLAQHRQQVKELHAKRDEAVKVVAQIDEERPALVARLLLTGGPMTEDDREQGRRAELARFDERVTVALPALADEDRRLAGDLRRAHLPAETHRDKLRELLERLRVEEAKRAA